MKRLYIGGALLSAMIHVPLLKEKEYGPFAVSVLGWPLIAILWLDYIRYATWAEYRHTRKNSS